MKTITDPISFRLYSVQATREIDRTAIEECNMPGYSLMSKAGRAVFELMQQHYPLAKRILVCCGAGNNAGDGYVVARLARQAGLDVDVVSMVDPEKLQGDAQQAYRDWKALGIHLKNFDSELLDENDVLIDALLGTGLQRPVEGEWFRLIEQINGHTIPVIAVDVPSGLNADTGNVMGIAVQARMTMSFIARKKGLYTGDAADYCGELVFSDLAVPADAYKHIDVAARLLDWSTMKKLLRPRRKNSHKGQHGHVLVVGGDYGMAGAIRLAGEAALRSGAGLVSVATRAEHVTALVAARPELMVWGISEDIPEALIDKADCILIGPGLGQGGWSQHLLSQVLQASCPKVVDADALNLLDQHHGPREDWVLTPHPGEAGRLLATSTAEVQQDRYAAVAKLHRLYGGSVLLKGAGSIVHCSHSLPALCPYGNPGMASAGMGDVLSGVIAALIAQGLAPGDALQLAVVVHAMAGDRIARSGQKGMLASDLFGAIHRLVNADRVNDIE